MSLHLYMIKGKRESLHSDLRWRFGKLRSLACIRPQRSINVGWNSEEGDGRTGDLGWGIVTPRTTILTHITTKKAHERGLGVWVKFPFSHAATINKNRSRNPRHSVHSLIHFEFNFNPPDSRPENRVKFGSILNYNTIIWGKCFEHSKLNVII